MVMVCSNDVDDDDDDDDYYYYYYSILTWLCILKCLLYLSSDDSDGAGGVGCSDWYLFRKL